MRAEHFHETPLKVRVPRGNEGFWQIICQLHKTQSTFTVSDIDGESNVNVKLIQKYIRLLVSGGFVERVNVNGGGTRLFSTEVYRLVKFQKRAPRIRPDGSLIAALSAMEHLWTAIRNMKTFGLKDLIFAATTQDVTPSYGLAKRYVCYLTTAGYLTVSPGENGKKVWHLKPAMNTGPLSPCIKEVDSRAIYDRNLQAFVGPAPIASEVSP